MTSPNYWALLDRLLADVDLDPTVATLVDAALQGDNELETALSLSGDTLEGGGQRPEGSAPNRPAGAFLSRMEVEGFRGIGPRVKLDIPAKPGLTMVVGRNGSGKSSIAEGFELLLTGRTLRWEGRTPKAEWQSGWRNLHHDGPVQLQARCHVEGRSEPVTLLRAWGREGSLDSWRFTVRAGTTELSGLDALAWEDALTSCRPFLSHNELATALEKGPSKLFDAFDALLGLDDVAAAITRLDDVRKHLTKRASHTKKQRAELKGQLEGSEDPRAVHALECFRSRSTDLDELETLVLATEEETRDEVLSGLRLQAALRAPTDEEVLAATGGVTDALDALAEVTGTDAGRADLTIQLLRQALGWDSAECPVCETPDRIDDAWRARAEERIGVLSEQAQAARKAKRDHDAAVTGLLTLVRQVANPPSTDLPSSERARAARAAWGEVPNGPAALVRHVESHLQELQEAFEAVRNEATAELEQLHVAWRPLQRAIAAWLERARADEEAKSRLDAAVKARDWLRAQEADLRDNAFRPIAKQAQETWEMLRQQSNVSLGGLKLSGTARSRHVDLDITVDGAEGVALGVMSQGELHALALSLFLPRLTRPDSPFRFVVIDDPVQAMDPAKVDGLARVLERAAKTHQVIVFTHDGRLRTAVERLKIEASVVQVRRHPDSRVELSPSQDAVSQHLSDAHHLAREEARLGSEVVRRVVPGLCRAAIEAAFVQRAWYEQLKAGRAHAEIAQDIAELHGATQIAAYGFYGDVARGGDVYPRLDRMHLADTFRAACEGSHDKPLSRDLDLERFIGDVRRLTREVLR